jgi:hypothetical protein
MTSNDQDKQNNKTKRYLIVEIGIVCLLLIGLIVWLQRKSPRSTPGNSVSPTLQINLPTVQYPTIPASAPDFSVPIQSVGNSGVSGTATFKDIGGVVAILLHVDGPPTDEENESIMPVEIHHGTCSSLGTLAYPMSAPDAGESETDLSINLKQFNTEKPMAVVFYRSPQDRTVIACGDVSD